MLIIRNIIFITLIGFSCLLISPIFAENYEVGPSKNYSSLQELTDILSAGDTVFVDGDNSYAGGVTFTEAGTVDHPIVIKGVPVNGKRPVISGGANTVHFSSPWPYTSGADNYIFEGFEITGGSSRGIFHQAGNLTVKDVIVHDCPAHGILGADQGAGSCFLKAVEVYNCGEGSGRHQIYMATDEVNRPGSVFRMEHCYIHDGNGGNNIKSRAERNEIYYNWIEGAYYHELELIGPDPGGAADGWNPGLKREDSDVVGNVLWKNGSNSNFSVVRFGGDATGETHGRYRFVNNTVICGTGSIFRCFDSLESIEMHNNVFFPTNNNTINLMRTVEANWTSGNEVIAGSNNWVYEDVQNIPQQWIGTIQGNNPGFEDFGNFDVNLQSNSTLVNNGASDISSVAGYEFPNPLNSPNYCPPQRALSNSFEERIDDGAIDIGAFEFKTDNSILNKTKMINNFILNKQKLTFELKEPTNISLKIYSLNGKEIIFLKSKLFPAGIHDISLNELGKGNKIGANAVYLLRFKKGSEVINLRMIN